MNEVNFPWIWVLSLILFLLILYSLGILYQRRRARKKGLSSVVSETAAPASLPGPRFSQAIASWLPLLKEENKSPERWEEVLIRSDMGPRLSSDLIQKLQSTDESPEHFFRRELKVILESAQAEGKPWERHQPWVVFVVGVNGAGKTTTLVKMGAYFQRMGKSVGVIAADTFRKAAVEQLERACETNRLESFSIKKEESSEGADPASVVFDGLKKFQSKEIILVDTSGRLHNKQNLMDELAKMKRVAFKAIEGAPQDIWLVIDATLGQNAVQQAESFHQTMGLSGLIITKLDGLSRGGAIFQMAQKLKLPVWFIGTGEKVEDLERFDPHQFVDELFDQRDAKSLT
jgi:fused signal recognition particle receptor